MKKLLVLGSICLFLQTTSVKAQNSNKVNVTDKQDSLFGAPWSMKSGVGTGIGMAITDFAGNITLNMNIRIPLSTYFALNVRPFLIPHATSDSNTTSAGGRIEFTARTKIMYNIIRAYASVGPQVFWGLDGTYKNEFDWSGGWVFGVEIFFCPYGSLHFEMGTSGGTVGNIGAGQTYATGFTFYPFYKHIK